MRDLIAKVARVRLIARHAWSSKLCDKFKRLRLAWTLTLPLWNFSTALPKRSSSYCSAVKYLTVSKFTRESVHISCQSLSLSATFLRKRFLQSVITMVTTILTNIKKKTVTDRGKNLKYAANIITTSRHSAIAGTIHRNKYFIRVSHARIPRSMLRMTSPSFFRKCQSNERECRWLKAARDSWTNAAWATFR